MAVALNSANIEGLLQVKEEPIVQTLMLVERHVGQLLFLRLWHVRMGGAGH